MSVVVVLVVAVDGIVAGFTVEHDTLVVIGGDIDENVVAGSGVGGDWLTYLMVHHLLG